MQRCERLKLFEATQHDPAAVLGLVASVTDIGEFKVYASLQPSRPREQPNRQLSGHVGEAAGEPISHAQR